jgi:hypothetical protein
VCGAFVAHDKTTCQRLLSTCRKTPFQMRHSVPLPSTVGSRDHIGHSLQYSTPGQPLYYELNIFSVLFYERETLSPPKDLHESFLLSHSLTHCVCLSLHHNIKTCSPLLKLTELLLLYYMLKELLTLREVQHSPTNTYSLICFWIASFSCYKRDEYNIMK